MGAKAAVDTFEPRLTVGDAMHRGVLHCSRTTSLRAVARIMAAHRVHCVVVTDEEDDGGGAVWGVVSDLDLAAALLARPLEEQTAEGTAATPAVLVREDDSLVRGAQLMTEHGVAHLVVVGRAGRPVGVLSTLDVAEVVS